MSKEFSVYQHKVIKDYYGNIDKIALTRLSELVTEIYLAQDEKKRAKLWDSVAAAMKRLKISPAVAANILTKKDPNILAKNISDWMKLN
jgi:hypothetical protein